MDANRRIDFSAALCGLCVEIALNAENAEIRRGRREIPANTAE